MIRIFLAIALLLGCINAHAAGFKSTDWMVGFGTKDAAPCRGMQVGSLPWVSDPRTGEGNSGLDLAMWDNTVFCLQHHEKGQQSWVGETGFCDTDARAPYLPGDVKSYANIYLWAKNVTLSTPNRVHFATASDDYDMIPTGYTGHLVLDYVPTECNWTGPTDFWLDLGKRNYFDLPTIVTADPLKGTKMHLTVYAPVPEPSCLAALATGITAIGGCAIRRRRI